MEKEMGEQDEPWEERNKLRFAEIYGYDGQRAGCG